MKWSEIKRRLKKYGCYKFMEASNHEIWKNPKNGKTKALGRHDGQEVRKKTAYDIFKVLDVPMYDD